MKRLITAWRSTIEWNTPRLSQRRVSREKKVSMAFSHEHAGVGGVVVEDHVDHFARRHRPLERVEKADELLVAVALHAAE
jgi:hypothetical protein